MVLMLIGIMLICILNIIVGISGTDVRKMSNVKVIYISLAVPAIYIISGITLINDVRLIIKFISVLT